MKTTMLCVVALLACAQLCVGAPAAQPAIPNNAPPPQPVDVYSQLAVYAASVPSNISQLTPKELVAYLTANAKDDTQKAWVIFNWVNVNGGTLHPKLGQVKWTECLGHSELFRVLCTEAGLKAENIPGKERHLGDNGQTEFLPHTWNRVFLQGTWKLVECTWEPFTVTNGQIIRLTNGYYFMAPPDEFVLSHIPDNIQLEGIPQPKTLAEIDKMPYARAYLFLYGLKIVSPNGPEVECPNGKGQIVLANPNRVELIPQVYQNGQQLPDQYVFGQQESDGYHIRIQLPQAGTYNLNVLIRSALNSNKWYDIATYYRLKSYAAQPTSR